MQSVKLQIDDRLSAHLQKSKKQQTCHDKVLN